MIPIFNNSVTKLLFSLFIIGLVACTKNAKEGLEYALKQAGTNRAELEKVLDYYSLDTSDSLKYKAACFLIENMLYHYYYENEALEAYKDKLKEIAVLPDTIRIQTLKNNFLHDTIGLINQKQPGLSNCRRSPVNDLRTITADYLIANIDHAFMVWEKQPWGKHIPFDLFCREILPYRIDDEPLEEWRETYYNYFQPVLDSLLTDDNPVTAGRIIYDTIAKMDWHFMQNLPIPHLGGKMILDYRLGNCREYSDFALYAMRALGICGGIDLIIQNPDFNFTYHYWNYLRDTTGRIREFELYEMPPDSVRKNIRLKGVVYRHHFCIQEETLRLRYPDREIPPTLITPFLSNVSADYFEGYDITIPAEKRDGLLYLYLFDNREWKPAVWSEIVKGKATFHSLEPGIAFFPGYYRKGNFIPAADPFVLREDKSARFFTPDTVNRIELVLDRKFRTRGHLLERYTKGTYRGRFEGADNPGFRDATTLFTVSGIEQPVYYEKELSPPRSFRYMRYVSADTLCCNIAEIVFQDSNGEPVRGEVTGSGCMFGEATKYSKTTVFDGDPLTFFEARDTTGGWAGMDFGKPREVGKIRFLFRNDDNNIREGDLYELFYYSREGYRKSLGKQTGNREQVLTFRDCPSNALYLLHDYTRGKEQRIFSYENGRQIWW